MKNKKTLIIIGTLMVLVIAGVIIWFFKPIRAVTGQASEEAYQIGQPTYFRAETFSSWDWGKLTELPNTHIGGIGFDLRSQDAS